MPFPVNNTLIEFLQAKMTEEQAKFLLIFRKPSLNLDEIKQKATLKEPELSKTLNTLMDDGILTDSISGEGVRVFTLMPLFPGILEFGLLKGESGEKEKRLARAFEKIVKELQKGAQRNYEDLMPRLKEMPPFSRVIPVEEDLQTGQEIVLLSEEASKLIDFYDTIALAHCYCKQQKELITEPCKVTHRREICLIFGKPGQFAIDHHFARRISKEEAKKKLKEAEDEGLVHKVFHNKLDFSRDLDGLCSCCKCCCGIFRMFYEGIWPFHTMTSYLAKPNDAQCTGCGTCIEKCPMEALSLESDHAVLNKTRCIGCGVCAHLCPEHVMTLERTGPREVFVMPPKIN